MRKIKPWLEKWWFVLILLAFMPVYISIAVNNERTVDYTNNGFFTFWLAGHMQWTGEQPYSSTDWVNGAHEFGATWIPNQIFPYPLPLALIIAPIGLLPIAKAYILWDTLAQLLIGCCILWLSTHWEGLDRQLFAAFVLLAAVLNGNIFLGLMTGTFAVLFLVFLSLGLYFLETRRPLLGGILLAGLALKPPLLVITALIGLWLLYQKNWKAMLGIATGGLGLLFIGLFQDPAWPIKFISVSSSLLDKRLGNQPTLPSYTRLLCSGDQFCTFFSYILIVLLLVATCAWLLWIKRRKLSHLEAFSAAIGLGVLLPPYLWSYDYALLIIPICAISFELIRRRKTYLYSTLFLLLIDIISIFGLMMFWRNPETPALTIQRDMWSIWEAVLVLAASWWVIFVKPDETQSIGTDSL
ncbi:MAG: glycosyltransferase family 87 protein [Chloroflexota bacterium]